MRSFLRKVARSAGFTTTDTRAAEGVLGRGHALTRALSSQHVLAVQSLVAVLAVAVGASGVLLDIGRAALFAGAAGIVGAVFLVAWTLERRAVRERVRDLIATGGDADSTVLPIVARERRHLLSRKQRERLARSLEGYVADASRWARMDPRSRPPREIRCLLFARGEARDVTRLVRSEAPSPSGVAALLRFLTDGQRSPLFTGDVPKVRWELLRIATLLEPDASRRARRAT
jgi:hypothetical protein